MQVFKLLEVSYAEPARGTTTAAGAQPDAGSSAGEHVKPSPPPSLQNGRRQPPAAKQEAVEGGTTAAAQTSGAGQAAVKQGPASDAAVSKDSAAVAAGRVLRHAAGRCRELLPLEFLRAELQVSRLSDMLGPTAGLLFWLWLRC